MNLVYQVADGEAEIYCIPHEECSGHPNYNLIRNKEFENVENRTNEDELF